MEHYKALGREKCFKKESVPILFSRLGSHLYHVINVHWLLSALVGLTPFPLGLVIWKGIIPCFNSGLKKFSTFFNEKQSF